MKIKAAFCTVILILFNTVIASAALDLKFVTTISMSPDPANAGELVQFSVSFRNVGEAVSNLKIIGGIDGTQLFERNYASILADKTKTDFFNWTATAGNHTVWFKLDPDHTTGDSNYSNNTVERQITIGTVVPTGKPNLTVTATYSPMPVTDGTNITFTAAVTNNGNETAPPSKLGFYVHGGLKSEYDIPALNIGQNVLIKINWTADCALPCNAYVVIFADYAQAIDESNEDDNQWIKSEICDCASNYKPNLRVSATYSPIKPKKGEKVTFNITVKNDGNKFSPFVYLGFYLAGTLINSFEFESMQNQTEKTITFDWNADCGQTCLSKIDLFIDSQNVAEESNETDNHWIKDIKCDCLIIMPINKKPIVNAANSNLLNIKLPNLTSTTKSYTCYPGQKKVDLLFGIKNIGTSAAGASKLHVRVYENMNLLAAITKQIGPLSVNQNILQKIENIHCVHNARMIVTIDEDKEIAESNESDNEWKETVACPNL